MNFAFLNLLKHPRGYLMLNRLIENGFIPKVIIEEDSLLAKKNRETQFKDLELNKEIKFDLLTNNIPYKIVENHNNEATKKAVLENRVDLIILGDCRIIKPHIFKIPKLGAINVHPGYLPTIRGNTPYIWAVYHQLPQGCTVHFIDEGIDTGSIIKRELVSLENIHSYKSLLLKINNLCAELIVDVLKGYAAIGEFDSINQADLLKEETYTYYFTLAPNKIKEQAIKMLSQVDENKNM